MRGARRGALGDWRLSLRQSRRYNRNIRRSLAPRREKSLPFRRGNDKRTSSISYFARFERRAPESAPASNDSNRRARRGRGPAIDGSATCSDAPAWRRASRFRANRRRDSDRTKREAALPLRRTQLSRVAPPTRGRSSTGRWREEHRGRPSADLGFRTIVAPEAIDSCAARAIRQAKTWTENGSRGAVGAVSQFPLANAPATSASLSVPRFSPAQSMAHHAASSPAGTCV